MLTCGRCYRQDGYDHSVETDKRKKKGKGRKEPRVVLAVGITHPEIAADWRKAYTVRAL